VPLLTAPFPTIQGPTKYIGRDRSPRRGHDLFVFQHPVIAWHFTQLREAVEGRNIRKEDFIDKFLGAKTTVDKLKTDFGDKLNLNIILKDYKDTKENRAVAKVFTNVKALMNVSPLIILSEHRKDSAMKLLRKHRVAF